MAAIALLTGGLASPAAAATSKATVKGVVTLDGKPVSFARVQLYRDMGGDADDPEYARVKTANTDSKGRYTISGVSLVKLSEESAGYAIVVSDRSGNIVRTHRFVRPEAGKVVTRNVWAQRAGIITGKVSRSDGGDPRALEVTIATEEQEATRDNYFVPEFATAEDATVKADGTFTLGGVAPRTYNALIVRGAPYASQCYSPSTNALADCDDSVAQRISVGAGERRQIAPLTANKMLPPATTVTGQVTDTSGKALKGINVSISGSGASEVGVTRSSGRFTVREVLPSGSYQVRYDDPDGVWASQYLGGGPDKSVRQPIAIVSGDPVRSVDTRLKSISNAKIATKTGQGTAKVAFRITRKASGSSPSGTLKLSYGDVSKTVTVTKGRATVTLTGLRKGVRKLVADYSGTGSTAGFSKTVRVTVK
ncbi:hypothetical protein ASD10_09325 [Aeromicrobium sp. Root472D3]|nr:hypothetical protein ASD10_09325 [Aeromicrobium sp. Root472D3]